MIDAAYVEKVMAALDHVYGDAIRILARERKITQDFLDRLAAIYGDRFFRLAQQSWSREALDGFATLASTPGDPTVTVTSLVKHDRECVIAAVIRDFSLVRNGIPATTPQRYIALIPKGGATNGLNPTPWVLSYDGWTSTGVEPSEPCSAN
ncbi:MAG TPA: hypothetical protein VM938_07795 [Acidimicrobiales bacterium]|nr:hypothetical protein [Acidimicrobiales bacterium]